MRLPSAVTVLSPSSVASRLIWPVAAVLLATVALVVAAVFWTSQEANGIAAEGQRRQLAVSLGDELDSTVRRLGNLASFHDLAVEAAAPGGAADAVASLLGRVGLDVVALVSRDGHVVCAWQRPGAAPDIAGELSVVAPPLAAALGAKIAAVPADAEDTPLPKHLGSARLLRQGDVTMTVTAVPASPGASKAALGRLDAAAVVGVQIVDADVLERIARAAPVAHLRIVEGTTDPLAIIVPDAAGIAAGSLVFAPDRPGDLIRARLVPLTLAAVLALALCSVLVVVHVRRIAHSLARSEERAQRLAGHDALSGLPNRLIFGDRLERELVRMDRGGDGLAVMFLDLDRFKDVNDTFGHVAGDELIRQVALRFSSLLRGTDTLARFGGDEFAVIQTGVRHARDAEALARRILEAVTHPFEVPGGTVTVGVSIGISIAPHNSDDPETLMRLADTALYQSKNEGRNRHSFFQRQMDDALKLRKIVEDDLRRAILSDEMRLLYQPVLSADGETIVGVEALVRWPHGTHGLISPGQFIAIAEERGLIIPLGEWVLRRACEDARRWPHLKVAVNVSPIQFRHRDFVASVTRVIERSGIDPTRLEIELTEGVVVDDADAAEIAMMELRALGVRLALDDFGTGYSSLIYLRRFAFDKIKIDRSFLESMEPTGESAILVHSVVHLGRALGLTVTAEGVETREQHRFLQAVGCHELQGFLFSAPVPAEEIDELLALRSRLRADAA